MSRLFLETSDSSLRTPHLISYSLARNHSILDLVIFVLQNKISTMQAYRFEKYSQSLQEINGSESYELRSANKLFLAKKLKLRDCIAHLFEEDIQPLDFAADPEAARQNINNWVEIQTKRQIQDLIPQYKLTPNTELVLVRWKHTDFKITVF
jgi:serpin B